MKLFGLTLSTLLLLAPGAVAAEYQGKILDSQPFEAQVYSFATGGVFQATVKFDDRRATIQFVNGDQLWTTVDQTITNPDRIVARSGLNLFGLGLRVGYSLDKRPGPGPQGLWLINLDDADLKRALQDTQP